MEDYSHRLHSVIVRSGRLRSSAARTERYRDSFIPRGIRDFNEHFMR